MATHMFFFFFNQPPYHDVLMQTARANIDDKQAPAAVVVAFMACEIFIEQLISFAFKKRGIEYLEDSVTTLLSGSSLNNDKNRKLYSALTGDEIQQSSFWSDFKACASLRNDAVHGGTRVSKADAQKVCDTIERVLEHLKKIQEQLRALPDPRPHP